ncbi:hypothetical protein [Streptomyces sp. cg35]|uniref:hypothetical protein n=1 Tax=Streptomyces sp. cg35 TaxID=3421650 RepID=UPI003D16CC10
MKRHEHAPGLELLLLEAMESQPWDAAPALYWLYTDRMDRMDELDGMWGQVPPPTLLHHMADSMETDPNGPPDWGPGWLGIAFMYESWGRDGATTTTPDVQPRNDPDRFEVRQLIALQKGYPPVMGWWKRGDEHPSVGTALPGYASKPTRMLTSLERILAACARPPATFLGGAS